ncbi:hypothetical protein FLONG3_7362 [Fusarium longipes]|uniref:Uncharacterized protein n=1 Tax=Fusarium longipes TaxID=694270 RepID=A0A395SE83_9HYPO|nr:hypothetical protein FLONG3_7362 [Fusarium longipes]
MKKNDVIAIIIIILFIILAGVSFGIWKLVSMAKNHMSATGRYNECVTIEQTASKSSVNHSNTAKLNLDCQEAIENPNSIARYQEYPFARFNHVKGQPDAIDKSSPEYRQRLDKVIKSLEDSYEKTYIEYQARRADFIAELEANDQRMWNRYILNPANENSPIEDAKLSGFDPIDFKDTFKKVSDHSELQDLQRDVYYIGRLLRIGRMEKARLEGSDQFVYLRNEWADMIGHEIDSVSVYSDLDDGSQRWSRSTCDNIIYD